MKRALFVKLGAIGDVVMAIPAARYLKDQGWHVTWMCGKSVQPLVEQFADVDEIVAIDDAKLLGGHKVAASFELLKTNFRILGKTYDSIFVGHTDKRYQFLASFASGARRSFGTELEGSYAPQLQQHHTVEYLRLVSFQPAGRTPNPENYWPKPFKQWTGRGSRKIAIAPGGAKNLLADDRLRRWPTQLYAELAEKLIRNGYEVEILGSKSDEWVLPDFKNVKVRSRIGEFDLMGSIQNLANYEVLVTHDSGPLHLGGLARVPVIGLFGPTRSEWRMPFQNGGVGLQLAKPLACQPCYDGKSYAVCSANRCMSELKVELVFEKILEIVRRSGSASAQV